MNENEEEEESTPEPQPEPQSSADNTESPESQELTQNEQTLQESFTTFSGYGSVLLIFSPSLAGMVIPINTVKMIALLPIQYPEKVLYYLRLVVLFSEDDALTKRLEGKMYSNKDLNKRLFIPSNKVFRFRSNYAVARGMNLLMKLLLNLVFFYLLKRKKSKEKEKGTKLPLTFWYKIIGKFIISQKMMNLSLNCIYLMTSLSTGVRALEFLLMMIDFILMLSLNLYFITSFKSFDFSKKKALMNFNDLLVKCNCIYQDKKGKFKMPGTVIINFVTSIKMGLAIALYQYPKLFSITFIFFTSLTLIYSLNMNNSDSMKVTRKALSLFYIFEAITHSLLAIFNISKKCFDSYVYQLILIWFGIVWILLGSFLMLSAIIETYFIDRLGKKKNEIGIFANELNKKKNTQIARRRRSGFSPRRKNSVWIKKKLQFRINKTALAQLKNEKKSEMSDVDLNDTFAVKGSRNEDEISPQNLWSRHLFNKKKKKKIMDKVNFKKLKLAPVLDKNKNIPILQNPK